MRRANSLEKTDAWKDWRKNKNCQQRMKWLDSIKHSMDLNLNKLLEIMKEREAWHASVHVVTKSQTRHQILALCLLYGPALTTVHDHWEDHSLDYADFWCLEWCLSFSTYCLGCHSFPANKQSYSDFMAAVTIHSDFGDQEEGICPYFHLFPFYLLCSNGGRCHDLSFLNI